MSLTDTCISSGISNASTQPYYPKAPIFPYQPPCSFHCHQVFGTRFLDDSEHEQDQGRNPVKSIQWFPSREKTVMGGLADRTRGRPIIGGFRDSGGIGTVFKTHGPVVKHSVGRYQQPPTGNG
jgi:hypothetical protein